MLLLRPSGSSPAMRDCQLGQLLVFASSRSASPSNAVYLWKGGGCMYERGVVYVGEGWWCMYQREGVYVWEGGGV